MDYLSTWRNVRARGREILSQSSGTRQRGVGEEVRKPVWDVEYGRRRDRAHWSRASCGGALAGLGYRHLKR